MNWQATLRRIMRVMFGAIEALMCHRRSSAKEGDPAGTASVIEECPVSNTSDEAGSSLRSEEQVEHSRGLRNVHIP